MRRIPESHRQLDHRQPTGEFPRPRPFPPADDRSRLVFRAERRRKRRQVAVMVGVFVLAVFGFFCILAAVGDGQGDFTTGFGSPASSPSTPKTQWRQGQVPYLYQTDPTWAKIAYGTGTVGNSGCGPTALSMAYVCLTGNTDKDPGAMARFSQANGFVSQGDTLWTLMTQGAQQLGLHARELSADADEVRAALEAGHPVVCSVGKGDFTREGHFIVLAGVDSTGRLLIRDPNSEQRSHQTWDIERVLGQCRNLWELSAG